MRWLFKSLALALVVSIFNVMALVALIELAPHHLPVLPSQEANFFVPPTFKKATPHDFLTDDVYKDLVIEVVFMTGAPPDKEALDYLVDNVLKLCHKDRVDLIIHPIGPQQIVIPMLWSPSLLDYFEQQTRVFHTTTKKLALYIAYLPGMAAPPDSWAGITIHSDSFFIARWAVEQGMEERATLMHEFGHILGLVNVGTPMGFQHNDTEHPPHCTGHCCMWWQTDGEAQSDEFDAMCLFDLHQAGGR